MLEKNSNLDPLPTLQFCYSRGKIFITLFWKNTYFVIKYYDNKHYPSNMKFYSTFLLSIQYFIYRSSHLLFLHFLLFKIRYCLIFGVGKNSQSFSSCQTFLLKKALNPSSLPWPPLLILKNWIQNVQCAMHLLF